MDSVFKLSITMEYLAANIHKDKNDTQVGCLMHEGPLCGRCCWS